MDPRLSRYQIGQYQLQDWIGRSRIGTVFQALDTAQDRPVAITLLSPRLVGEPGFLAHVLRRMRSVARLRHPSILGIYEIGQAGEHHYVVTEYTPGRVLAQLLEQVGAIHPNQAYPIVRQLAEALDYAHLEGWVYGDLRADNVVIGTDGRALLVDRQILWDSVETEPAGLEISAYTPPEQITGGEIGLWSDRYALGVIAYETLGGSPPFQAQTTAALLYQIAHQPPPPLRARWPDLPEGVDQVIGRMLAKDPGHRYASAIQFADALGAALGQEVPALSPFPQQPPADLPSAEELERWAPPQLAELATVETPAVHPEGKGPAPTAAPEDKPVPSAPPPEEPGAAPDALATVPLEAAPTASLPWAAPGTPAAPGGPSAESGPPSPPARSPRLVPVAPPEEQAPPKPALWPWILLAVEALILLGGVVLLVLFLRGVL